MQGYKYLPQQEVTQSVLSTCSNQHVDWKRVSGVQCSVEHFLVNFIRLYFAVLNIGLNAFHGPDYFVLWRVRKTDIQICSTNMIWLLVIMSPTCWNALWCPGPFQSTFVNLAGVFPSRRRIGSKFRPLRVVFLNSSNVDSEIMNAITSLWADVQISQLPSWTDPQLRRPTAWNFPNWMHKRWSLECPTNCTTRGPGISWL